MSLADDHSEPGLVFPDNDQPAAWACAFARASDAFPGFSSDAYTMTLWFNAAMVSRERPVLRQYDERLKKLDGRIQRAQRFFRAAFLLIAVAIIILALTR